jgi:hypothetical protein
MTEEEHYELATWLADKIFEASDEADCDPAVLMQACIWVLGYLLRAMVPPGHAKRCARAAYQEALDRDVPHRTSQAGASNGLNVPRSSKTTWHAN